MLRNITAAIKGSEKQLFTALFSILVVLLTLYGYFISMSIIDVLVREEIEQEMVALSSVLSDLEFEYITQQEHIDATLADQFGLVKIDEKHFVTRRSVLSQMITLRDEI
jgi:hypothetical protein